MIGFQSDRLPKGMHALFQVFQDGLARFSFQTHFDWGSMFRL
jgi:hypothetical protein